MASHRSSRSDTRWYALIRQTDLCMPFVRSGVQATGVATGSMRPLSSPRLSDVPGDSIGFGRRKRSRSLTFRLKDEPAKRALGPHGPIADGGLDELNTMRGADVVDVDERPGRGLHLRLLEQIVELGDAGCGTDRNRAAATSGDWKAARSQCAGRAWSGDRPTRVRTRSGFQRGGVDAPPGIDGRTQLSVH